MYVSTFLFIFLDCQWTDFSDWSPCTASCNTGTQTKTRTVAQIARNGGRRCSGSPFETRTCNTQKCPSRRTTVTTTTTTTTTTKSTFVDRYAQFVNSSYSKIL